MNKQGLLEEESLLRVYNYKEHPSRAGYVVFFFAQANTAEIFKQLLANENIVFEYAPAENIGDFHLFGLAKSDFKRAKKLNYHAIGKTRPKLFSKVLFVLLSVLVGLLVLAVLAGIWGK
jgi:hypothetical protein